MSLTGDALVALKNVVLMQERMDVMRQKLDRLSSDVRGLNDYAMMIDKRVVRIETMVEMASGAPSPPRIEG